MPPFENKEISGSRQRACSLEVHREDPRLHPGKAVKSFPVITSRKYRVGFRVLVPLWNRNRLQKKGARTMQGRPRREAKMK